MRVMVFSHVRLFCETLGASLETLDDVNEVRACHVATHLTEEVVCFCPDIFLFHLTSEESLGEIRAVSDASPETLIMAVAVPESPEKVIACADAGICGYVPPGASIMDLHAMLKMALKGECVCPPRIAGSLLREVRRRRESANDLPASDSLTARECKVLSLVARGLSNKEIARELALSVATVKNHMHNIFSKLHVTCRAQALVRLRNEPWLTGFGQGALEGTSKR